MGRMNGTAATIGLALAMCGLSACNSATDKPADGQTANAKAAREGDVKHSGYVSAFNALAQNGFLANNATAYASYNVPKATSASTLGMMFNTDYTVPIIDELKKARAEKTAAVTDPLDGAADALIPPLEEIVRIERELGPYYSSRAYREDNVAKGKAADGPLKAAYARALAAYDRLGGALSVYERTRNTQRIAELKAGGHHVEASMVSALAAAETMITAYTKGDDAAAARQSTVVAAALDQMRANESKLEKVAGNEHVYKNVLDQLTQMQGLFSDYRNGDRTARDRVLTKYNSAVSISNQYRYPD